MFLYILITEHKPLTTKEMIMTLNPDQLVSAYFWVVVIGVGVIIIPFVVQELLTDLFKWVSNRLVKRRKI